MLLKFNVATFIFLLSLCLMPHRVFSDQAQTVLYASLSPARGAIIQPLIQPVIRKSRTAPTAPSPRKSASLFAGQPRLSLFEPLPSKSAARAQIAAAPRHGSPVERIRHIIGRAESHKHGYDAVQHGAKRKPVKRPTDMTIGEIYRWIADTPGQPHAIGRYQFIPATLKRLVNKQGIGRHARFDPRLQDQLSDILLEEAGFSDARHGTISRHRFMNNLAQIWAGLPTSSGKSYYHGYAGNRASMTWADFDAEMVKAFPG